MKFKTRIITLLTLTLVLFFHTTVRASDYYDPKDFIFIDELMVGMIGEAHTVIEGSRIDTFTVELLGIARDSGFNNRHFLLCKVSGDVIDKTGGIAGGMSGSPVYFSGRLAGAVSGHWSYTDQTIGIVTPIEYMLEELDFVRIDLDYENPPVLNQAWKNRENRTAYTEVQEIEILPSSDSKPSGDKPAFLPVATPVSISGLEDSDIELIRPLIDQFGDPELINAPQNYPVNVRVEPKLVEGGTIAIPMSVGDVSYGGYGTITWISDDGKYFLGFGHSMGRRGPCKVPAGTGYIYGVLRSMNRSTKIGAALEPVAVVYQDRGDAIAGVIGDVPEYIPVKVSIESDGSDEKTTMRSAVIPSWDEYPNAATAVVTGSISRALDGDNDGTLTVRTTIRVRLGDDSRWFRKENIYTGTDVLTQYRDDLQLLLLKLRDTDLEVTSLESVDVSVSYNPVRFESRIEGLELLTPDQIKELSGKNNGDSDSTYDVLDDYQNYGSFAFSEDDPDVVELKPGATYLAAVRIVNYRAPRETVYIPFYVPGNFEKGKARITAKAASGEMPSASEVGSDVLEHIKKWNKDRKNPSDKAVTDVEEYINDLFETSQDNKLILEIVSEKYESTKDQSRVFIEVEVERIGTVKGAWEIQSKIM